jgi:hypothetical protein
LADRSLEDKMDDFTAGLNDRCKRLYEARVSTGGVFTDLQTLKTWLMEACFNGPDMGTAMASAGAQVCKHCGVHGHWAAACTSQAAIDIHARQAGVEAQQTAQRKPKRTWAERQALYAQQRQQQQPQPQTEPPPLQGAWQHVPNRAWNSQQAQPAAQATFSPAAPQPGRGRGGGGRSGGGGGRFPGRGRGSGESY